MRLRIPISLALVISLAWVFLLPTIVYAENEQPIAITVVVPRPDIQPTPTPNPIIQHHVYPVQVWESREHGRREIIRIYELRENESPAHIPREPFEREGFRFELAEIIRREIPSHSSKEHVETVSVNTQANDLQSILRLLPATMEYTSDDGYIGLLTLDVASIRIESQGTRSSNYTSTRTREFPHLTSPDTALVPRTITENGRTYNLADIEWRTQSTTAVDFTQVATSFTAIATYTRAATRTSTIGYTTTAEYRGTVSRLAVGVTEFTVQFIGIPIVTPVTNADYSSGTSETVASDSKSTESTLVPTPTPEPPPTHAPSTSSGPTVVEKVTVEQVHIGGIVIGVEHTNIHHH